MDARPLVGAAALRDDRALMDAAHARALAQQLHAGECEADGARVLVHLRRVAHMVPIEARPVAWLHEVLTSTVISEQWLLHEGLTMEQLRALRLLARTSEVACNDAYLARLELVARAAGESGRLARTVKIADLADRCVHPRVRTDGWTPPYAEGLRRLLDPAEDRVSGDPLGAPGRAALA